MNEGYDITEDIAIFMTAYVEWIVEEGSHISEEAAREAFMRFVTRVMAVAWDEGYEFGAVDEALGATTENPYDREEA